MSATICYHHASNLGALSLIIVAFLYDQDIKSNRVSVSNNPVLEMLQFQMIFTSSSSKQLVQNSLFKGVVPMVN